MHDFYSPEECLKVPNMKDVAREAHAALKRCKQKQAPMQKYDCDEGNSRKGWTVCLLHYQDGEQRYSDIGNYEQWWGNSALFLGEDGKIYLHDFRGYEYGAARSGTGKTEVKLSNRVRLATIDDLKNPLLVFKEKRPYFVAVIEGLQSLPH